PAGRQDGRDHRRGRPPRRRALIRLVVGSPGRRGLGDGGSAGGQAAPRGRQGQPAGGPLTPSPLLRRSAPAAHEGTLISVTPTTAGWTYVGFEVVRLAPGRPWSASLAGREACVVLLSGRCSVSGAGAEWP